MCWSVICLDKTGTLTRGVFELDEHLAFSGDDRDLLAAAVLACEPNPDDVLEVAILRHARAHGVDGG